MIEGFDSNSKLCIIIPDFFSGLELESLNKDYKVSIIPLTSYNKIPPVIFYMLKHLNSKFLKRIIIKKIFRQKEILAKNQVI